MLENREGKKVPNVVFRTRQGDQWQDVKSQDIFDGRTVVVFSLPGAFTPTCSSTHLPRYNELAGVLKQNGVDEIAFTNEDRFDDAAFKMLNRLAFRHDLDHARRDDGAAQRHRSGPDADSAKVQNE